MWHTLYIEITALASLVLLAVTIPWVLMTKRDATSAVAWCLLVLFMPIFGSLLFVIFGYQHVHRPLKRKRQHLRQFRKTHPAARPEAAPRQTAAEKENPSWGGLAQLARRFGAFPVTPDNRVTFYYEGRPAFEAMKAAIRAARRHVHMETFIFQPDATGGEFVELLTQKARDGVEVRLLYDAMGSHRLGRRLLAPLRAAGGKCSEFLPLAPLRRRVQVNMRDHRKVLVIDGHTAFTGGLNVGDEYLGLCPRYGFWRDTHLRLQGPAVAALQRVFVEDWDFAAEENLYGPAYFPETPPADAAESAAEPPAADGCCAGPLTCPVQVIQSGPDQEVKGIREIYFAAMQRARQRLWIASPYFVPDAALLDALCLAAYTGVDVRLLCQYHPDKWIPFFAGRYYWATALEAGVKVYQYQKGMMHAKEVLVDGEWASVGTANLDNRSLHLNFEVNCLIFGPEAVAELERAFLRDLQSSILLDRDVYAARPFAGRLVENACRLMSPVL